MELLIDLLLPPLSLSLSLSLSQLIINLKQSNLSNKELLIESLTNIVRRCAGYLLLAFGFLAFLFANNGEFEAFAFSPMKATLSGERCVATNRRTSLTGDFA